MDAWIGVVGVSIGAVIGLFGNAAVERWRRTSIRKDARTDRQAATLREALGVYTEFVLAWAPLANRIALGGMVDIRDADVVAGPPGQTHRRLVAVTERVHIESIRYRLGQFTESVVVPVANNKVTATMIDANATLGTEVAADIGTELRRLEAQ